MNTCIHDTTLITCRSGPPEVLPHYSVLFDNNVITDVLPAVDAAQRLERDRTIERMDGSRHVLVPGLINTHHHLTQTLTRGLKSVQDAELFDWLIALYERWRHIDHTSVRLAAQVSIAEMLLSGCTTTSDHFYMFPEGTDARIESVLEAADALGIRIHACRGSMSVGRSKGGLPPDDCVEDEGKILADCARVVDAHHDRDPLAMVRIDLAPCSPFSISAELLRETARFARERGVLLHTHAAETLDEENYCLERFGMRPIPYLRECGWLGRDVYLAHCVHLSEEDIDALVETETAIAHCPCSNMRLGSGIPPVRKLLERHARVGIGVDGSSSNDCGHVLGEARQALLLQRVNGGATAMRVADAFRIATIGGADVLGRDKLGRIEPGCAADMALFRSDDVTLAGAMAQDPLAALILCRPARADRVFVNGHAVVADGQLTRIDEHKLAVEFNHLVAERFR